MKSVSISDFLEGLIYDETHEIDFECDRFNKTMQRGFRNRRIHSKYIELCKRYVTFTDQDDIFSEMVMIITELVKDKECIKVSESGKADEISWIITTVEQRMYGYIQENYTMNFRDRSNGKDVINNHFISFDEYGLVERNDIVALDEYVYLGDGDYASNHEIYAVGDNNPEEYEYLLGMKKLDELMTKCKLTQSQKDLVIALDKTRDVESGIYNVSEAARLLGRSRKSVSESWQVVQNKMQHFLEEDYLKKEKTRIVEALTLMIDTVDSYEDVLFWLKESLPNSTISELFYKINPCERRQVIRAINTRDEVPEDYYKSGITSFLREVHLFLRNEA